ncbi:RNA polymerase sigma factor [Hymenobacter sp. GOD-10R]|uniref:RNA polymerase sigma factor n=1 Tax=Hymenobacter sp. GOD-10R TaxID=3093922 RepID=UPI002D78261F|nr:sigma-70 family RNA polymerase sigma factor [Hymenobacter sp. GOD-10R]WRQ26151.1 sigma-70 family RNA polymerase sigma factor [Hymenobacter sp. GOD-10R]
MFSQSSSDAQLWDAVREDDVQAFAALFNRYWARMHQAACALHSDPEVCASLIHDIFLNLWLKRHQFEIDSFPRYLMAATRYHVYRHSRSARLIPLHYSEDLASTGTNRNAGEEQLHSHELEQRVAAYLAQLPKRCQEIFWLSRREQLSGDEIAARLGISKRTVENQITHALHHLKLSLKDLWVVLILLGSW